MVTTDDKHEAVQLFNDVTNWVSRQDGWRARAEMLDEDDADRPGLRIDTNKQERVHLELLGRRADGTLLVEMYGWPTLIRVRLRKQPGDSGWDVVTDTGIPIMRKWDEHNFVELVHNLSQLP